MILSLTFFTGIGIVDTPTWIDDIFAKVGNPDAQKSLLDVLTEEMQQQADESTFIIQIYSRPVFANGKAEGNLMIANDKSNICEMSVGIYLDDNGAEIYQTDWLQPGDEIKKDVLSTELEKGEYPATAVFTARSLKTGEIVGQAAAGITITIEG